MSTVLALHFGFATIWLGCVVTEALFERALLAGDRSAHLTLADLHVRVDKFIEVPAILVVLMTACGCGVTQLRLARPFTSCWFRDW